jgi:hypothetical protein
MIIGSREILGNTVSVYGTFEDPLFLAKDVAEWIGHQDVSSMLRGIDEDEKIKLIPPAQLAEGLQPNTEYWFLKEDGAYEVLLTSRLPVAKTFRKGVKKLLHDLRTGAKLLSTPTVPPFPGTDTHHLFYIGDRPLAAPKGFPLSLSVSKTGVVTVRIKEPKPPMPKGSAKMPAKPQKPPEPPVPEELLKLPAPKPNQKTIDDYFFYKGRYPVFEITLTGIHLKAANNILKFLRKYNRQYHFIDAIFNNKSIIPVGFAKNDFYIVVNTLVSQKLVLRDFYRMCLYNAKDAEDLKDLEITYRPGKLAEQQDEERDA